MSDIVSIINGLGGAIERLESAAMQQEQKLLHLQQQDLFSDSDTARPALDRDAVASKLDSAIQKVELLLQEA